MQLPTELIYIPTLQFRHKPTLLHAKQPAWQELHVAVDGFG
jgi:hypothetical protein